MTPDPIVGTVQRFESLERLARAAADGFVDLARASVAERGRFDVALTGGSSPHLLYDLLGREEWAARIPWESVHLFWGDDRCVPPRHPRSNFRLADERFISRVRIPESNVHRVRGELRPEVAASAYADELRTHFGSGLPVFDLVHLGLGDDGHVASLFPFDLPNLTERERPVLTSLRLPLGEHRVTLSYGVLNAARRIEFLLPDPGKAAIARRAMHGPLDPFRIPAQAVRPAGELFWMTAL